MDLLLLPTVIAGETLIDDYCVIHECRSVGRIMFATNRSWQGVVWVWHVNPPRMLRFRMIEVRYTDEEWQYIAKAADHWIGDREREALEKAVHEYLSSRPTVLAMKNAAQQRKQWQAARKKAESLSDDVRELGLWDTWFIDGELDRERATLLETLGKFVNHATWNELEFDQHAKSFRGQQDPNREDLYREVLRVWENLGRGLAGTSDGPLVRFFQAVVSPALGDDTPASATICSIVNREKARRKAPRTTERPRGQIEI